MLAHKAGNSLILGSLVLLVAFSGMFTDAHRSFPSTTESEGEGEGGGEAEALQACDNPNPGFHL